MNWYHRGEISPYCVFNTLALVFLKIFYSWRLAVKNHFIIYFEDLKNIELYVVLRYMVCYLFSILTTCKCIKSKIFVWCQQPREQLVFLGYTNTLTAVFTFCAVPLKTYSGLLQDILYFWWLGVKTYILYFKKGFKSVAIKLFWAVSSICVYFILTSVSHLENYNLCMVLCTWRANAWETE